MERYATPATMPRYGIMMRFDTKNLEREASGPGRRGQAVMSPSEHQGIKDALRGAFHDPLDIPLDLQALLTRIR